MQLAGQVGKKKKIKCGPIRTLDVIDIRLSDKLYGGIRFHFIKSLEDLILSSRHASRETKVIVVTTSRPLLPNFAMKGGHRVSKNVKVAKLVNIFVILTDFNYFYDYVNSPNIK